MPDSTISFSFIFVSVSITFVGRLESHKTVFRPTKIQKRPRPPSPSTFCKQSLQRSANQNTGFCRPTKNIFNHVWKLFVGGHYNYRTRKIGRSVNTHERFLSTDNVGRRYRRQKTTCRLKFTQSSPLRCCVSPLLTLRLASSDACRMHVPRRISEIVGNEINADTATQSSSSSSSSFCLSSLELDMKSETAIHATRCRPTV